MFVRQAMSKRILGVGIILGGLIILAIALIIGIGFPKFVYETNLKAVCIQDASHPRYKLWVCSFFLQVLLTWQYFKRQHWHLNSAYHCN